MSATNDFAGLTMPVFTAFGWAGEETAIKYALSQLEEFIAQLHANLPNVVRVDLPFFGLSREGQGVFLAADKTVENDVHIAFFARPLSLELQLTIANKEIISRSLKQIQKDIGMALHLLKKLGPDWTLRIQQMQYVEGIEEPMHYQDLYRASVADLTEEVAAELFNKAEYLNSEETWVTPIYLSQRVPAEQAAAMGRAVVQVMAERISSLMPLVLLLSGRMGQKGKAARPIATKSAPTPSSPKRMPLAKVPLEAATAVAKEAQVIDEPLDVFTFVTELKPLHIRRGFVNLTPEHWPFFAKNARTETRPVIVDGHGLNDKDSAMWRLQPNDMARLVLGPAAHGWLEDHFQPNDKIQLTVSKISSEEIHVYLELAE